MKNLKIRKKIFVDFFPYSKICLSNSTSTKIPREGTSIPTEARVIRAGGRLRRQAHVGMRLANWLEESLNIELIKIEIYKFEGICCRNEFLDIKCFKLKPA